MNLEFNVNNQIIKRIDSEKVISKSRNIYTAIFNFIDTTENLFIDENIFVIFQDSWGKRKTIFLGKYNSALSCNVPNDVLKGTYFKISIYAGDLVTTNIVTIPLIESNYSTCDTIQEEDYYKDIFVEIFNQLDAKVDKIKINGNYLEIYKENVLIESIWMDTVNEEFVRDLIDDKAEKIHQHITDDVSDFEEKVEIDLDVLLDGLTETIRQI